MAHRSVIPFGPQHPVLPEPLHLDLVIEDDRVIEAIPQIGFVHRGLEKLTEKRDMHQFGYIAERICGICAVGHSCGYASACERMLDIEVPGRVQYIRTILHELSRIHSHLLWLGLLADAFGFEALFYRSWTLREQILKIFESTCGGRVILSINEIGGLKHDIEDSELAGIVQTLDAMRPDYEALVHTFLDDASCGERLHGVVGYAGLKPTMNAIRARKAIALANKETLVVAGELINQLAQQYRTPILPVDSEHSAVFQCLAGEVGNPIEKVILTASGGPFRTYTLEQLKTVTKTQALKHPNWEMGAKITIDSASMMNKGFEVIEAKWLFGVQPGQIEVVVHPQSVIHSMVQFEDGAVKAQLGMPDMRLPIQYAFSYPDRISASFERLDFAKCTNLTFEQPDTKRFRNLSLAYEAMYRGGNMPCIVNAANEVVVASFLKDGISFLGMSDVIEKTMEQAAFVANPSYEDYVATDEEARRIASELVRRQNPQK